MGKASGHVPVMLGALKLIQQRFPQARAKMVVPSQMLADLRLKFGILPGQGVRVVSRGLLERQGIQQAAPALSKMWLEWKW